VAGGSLCAPLVRRLCAAGAPLVRGASEDPPPRSMPIGCINEL
jgi:hypothetical protein